MENYLCTYCFIFGYFSILFEKKKHSINGNLAQKIGLWIFSLSLLWKITFLVKIFSVENYPMVDKSQDYSTPAVNSIYTFSFYNFFSGQRLFLWKNSNFAYFMMSNHLNLNPNVYPNIDENWNCSNKKKWLMLRNYVKFMPI